jgi:hypothetical protein
MTSASNSTAQPLGFTTYGRPVIGAVFPSSQSLRAFLDAMPTAPPETAPAADADYLLAGESGVIVRNLKSFAFAKARALHWSRALGETVAVCRRSGDGAYDVEESVVAHTMSAAEYAAAWLEAEVARLEDARDSLAEVAMDVRAAREDAQEALDSLRAARKIDGAPVAALAEAARGFAESFETRAWYVLIDEADTDMAGELSAQ